MKTVDTMMEYIGHHGSDLLVVNAARASFGKESAWLPSGAPNDYEGVVYQNIDGHPVNLSKGDANLIRFLATGFRAQEWDDFLNEIIGLVTAANESFGKLDVKAELTKKLHEYKRKAQHWAPFGHPHLTLRMKLPIFLARQFVKHQVGGVWSEESRRYMSNEPEFWFQDSVHARPADIKQGSGGEPAVEQSVARDWMERTTENSLNTYQLLLDHQVAPEEARTILTLNTMTTVVWTGSLLFWARVRNQRVDSHAQLAAQELGRKLDEIVGSRYPVSWAALTA